jgi:heat-inducible transcriptional repressor
MKLSERRERILKTIVELYVAEAHPVGSSAIVAASGLSVSSATVRNEMAFLEDEGYIRQLHTSGGRVPTNAGYRYYVERLMGPSRLSSAEALTIRHQFHQAPIAIQEWLKLAATIMAHRLHNVGLVTAPKTAELRLRHLEVIAIQQAVALVIVVLQDGTVLQEMSVLPETRTQEELSPLADRLSVAFRGMTADQVEGQIGALGEQESAVARVAVHLLQRGEEQSAPVFHAGLADLIQQPEFAAPRPGGVNERLRHMLEFLQQGFAVERLLQGLPRGAHVQVVIGEDTPTTGLQDYSFVFGRYGDESDASGYLGVLGPTRMQYPRAVALVRYMSDLMSDLMQAY